MRFILLYIYFISTISLSQSQVILSFCSDNAIELAQIKKNIHFLKIPEDKIQRDSSCILVNTSQERENLFFKFIKGKFNNIKYSSTNDSFNRSCHLKIVKKTLIKGNVNSIGNNNTQINLRANDFKRAVEEEIIIKTFEKKELSVTIDQAQFQITCSINKTGYQLSTSSSSPRFKLHTNITVPFGSSAELGQYNKLKQNDNKVLGIRKNQLSTDQSNESILLTIYALK